MIQFMASLKTYLFECVAFFGRLKVGKQLRKEDDINLVKTQSHLIQLPAGKNRARLPLCDRKVTVVDRNTNCITINYKGNTRQSGTNKKFNPS